MKTLVFDTGPIISLATNDLLWTLKELKKEFNGNFIISDIVKKELIDKPLKTKKYKFEAITILNLVKENVLQIVPTPKNFFGKLKPLMNKLYYLPPDNYITTVHDGEISSLALAIEKRAEAFVVDERTTRLLIEDPIKLLELLRKKLHTRVLVNEENLNKFLELVKNIKVIRSTELMMIAYEKNLFKNLEKLTAKKELIDGLLWGLKLRGCSIAEDEIKEAEKILK